MCHKPLQKTTAKKMDHAELLFLGILFSEIGGSSHHYQLTMQKLTLFGCHLDMSSDDFVFVGSLDLIFRIMGFVTVFIALDIESLYSFVVSKALVTLSRFQCRFSVTNGGRVCHGKLGIFTHGSLSGTNTCGLSMVKLNIEDIQLRIVETVSSVVGQS